MHRIAFSFACLFAFALPCLGETLRHPAGLHQQLLAADSAYLAEQVRVRGDAQRGALVFYKSAAACVLCHSSGGERSPLGPNLAKLDPQTDIPAVLDALLRPSKTIAKGYETLTVVTVDGEVHRGLLVSQSDAAVTLRDAADLTNERVIARDDIEVMKASSQSMMPDGLMSTLPDQRQFLDLVAYVTAVAQGGPPAAERLQPTAEQLKVHDDSVDLDHAGIIKGLGRRDLEAGQTIYHGYCVECHGPDGNRPSLPTARAFGTQKLRFGADPYAMFMTLTRGNGLMAPMSHLTPKERYQVVHYIRETFMRKSNPGYRKPDAAYLASLPKGTKSGDEVPIIHRDFGPALASQLRRDFPSVLSVHLGEHTIAYNTHTMDQADLWSGDFVDTSQTQHNRDRGEGTVNPGGAALAGLAGWRWGHDGALDYPQTGLLPRGPLPSKWLRYRGYHLHGRRVVLDYSIDDRPILETPLASASGLPGVRQRLRIGAGQALVLAVTQRPGASAGGVLIDTQPLTDRGPASHAVAVVGTRGADRWQSLSAAVVRGDTEGLSWSVDARQRLVLSIPADTQSRLIEIERLTATDATTAATALDALQASVSEQGSDAAIEDPATLIGGGPANWPDVLQTTGYLGLERGAYALDTITIPSQTPWNTWFRTAALDFFSDGRMAVSTYGGDVWIISGIDQELRSLRWKRFAGGLYEPLGLKIVDDVIYLTCKDRVTRLHDRNADGEADFYESFSADDDVSIHFHAFNFDLQHDAEGNFYYAKAGHGADYALPGAIIQISPDGSQRSIYCTGFRSPNGMGILPDGRLTVSDNQGQWTPASKINLLRRGGFYGWVPSYNLPGKWAPDGGRLDLDSVVPPKTYDPPLVSMPQEFDNSSGGQLWVDDPRWGPLSGHLLHTSFGKGWMSYLMMQEVDGMDQAAIIKLPFDWQSGIMRARVNPQDGQVYAVGLQGWNGGGRIGLQDKGIQRLRYTGRPEWMVTDAQVTADGLHLRFTQPIDAASAALPDAFAIRHWNYRWQASYGSEMYSPTTDKVGPETLDVATVHVDDDRQGVRLVIPKLQPVDQLHLITKLKDDAGEPLLEEIYWTIHAIPSE
ncbi:DUF6797 domain-containing protein [Roseimaritima ulvae]|uniref:Cytochrome c n=1 Tax=Roseimaritima ulvae TaxID=980254 RepID=A0A5B9R8Q0_9BACT|nr:DUF6797 domain-containing protein [Roseimaritima ulvae]QEG43033.1 Cytochrome c [Roseimaritima ulvae]